MGMTHTSVANTLFIVSTSPLFAALIARLILREAVAARTWGAIAATILGIGGLVAALVALPLAAPLTVGGSDLWALGVMGLVMIPLSFGLLFVGPRYLPAPEVELMMLLEAVLGPLWVWLIIGENPGLAAIIGGTIVLGALAVHAVLALREEPAGKRSSAAIRP